MAGCVIFDLDGTLIDSETHCLQALVEIIPGLSLSPAELLLRFRGRKLDAIFGDICAEIDCELPDDIELTYRKRSNAPISKFGVSFSGVEHALSCIDLPICVASGGPLSKIEMLLSKNGLLEFFGGSLFSSYHVNSWKPSPDLFLHASRSMGAMPERCIVVEDSEVGISAAIAAGMTPVHFCETGAKPLSSYNFSHYSQLSDIIKEICSKDGEV